MASDAKPARRVSAPSDWLLAPGELQTLVAGLEILDAREGEVSGAQLASIAARRPACARG